MARRMLQKIWSRPFQPSSLRHEGTHAAHHVHGASAFAPQTTKTETEEEKCFHKKKLTERIASGLGMEKCVRKRETLSRRTEQRKTFEANFRPFSLSLCLLATFFLGALTCSLECNIFDAGLFFLHCARLHQTHKSLHRNHNPFFAFPDASHHILPLNLILLRSAHARSLSTLPSTKFSTLFPLLAPFLSF